MGACFNAFRNHIPDDVLCRPFLQHWRCWISGFNPDLSAFARNHCVRLSLFHSLDLHFACTRTGTLFRLQILWHAVYASVFYSHPHLNHGHIRRLYQNKVSISEQARIVRHRNCRSYCWISCNPSNTLDRHQPIQAYPQRHATVWRPKFWRTLDFSPVWMAAAGLHA